MLLWLVVFVRYCGLFWGSCLGSCCLQPAAKLFYELQFLPPSCLGHWSHHFGAWVSISAGILVSIAGQAGVRGMMYWAERGLGRGETRMFSSLLPTLLANREKNKKARGCGKGF